MDLTIVILTCLFVSVVALFAFCLTEPRGKNTVHARRNNRQSIQIKDTYSGEHQAPMIKPHKASYTLKSNETEAA